MKDIYILDRRVVEKHGKKNVAIMHPLPRVNEISTEPAQCVVPQADETRYLHQNSHARAKHKYFYKKDCNDIVMNEEYTCVCRNGVVTAKHPLAVKAGLDVLKKGGNAFDAVVATSFALGVVEPFSSGIGGSGITVVYSANSESVTAIDDIGITPLAATPDMYELEPSRGKVGFYGWTAVKDDANLHGYKSCEVPGSVSGLSLIHEKFGSLDFKELLEPSIKYAEKGFQIDNELVLKICQRMKVFNKFPEAGKVFLKNGFPPLEGELLIQKELSETLRKIGRYGAEVFYKGDIAQLIAKDMEKHGGLINMKDLENYQAKIIEPRTIDYEGYDIYTVADGGTTMIEILNILEGLNVSKIGFNTYTMLHILSEAIKLAFKDRYELMSGNWEDMPLNMLESKKHAAVLREKISMKEPLSIEHNNTSGGMEASTTHLTVIDKDRNIVSRTQSLGGSQSGVLIKDTGIYFNDQMWSYDPTPGSKNSIAPRKRRLSANCPSVLLKEGVPFLGVGAPGGRRIITTMSQILINIISHGMGIREAFDAPRVFSDSEQLLVDHKVPLDVISKLKKMGHRVQRGGGEEGFATPNGIMICEDGMLYGAVDRNPVVMPVSQAKGF